MRITSICRTSFYGAQSQELDFEANKKKKEYKDPLANWPLRGLGYSNDIGIAINEISPTIARLFWVPALMYFGADVYDKYKNKGNEYNPSGKRAFSQAVFQAMASIALPTVSGHIGQTVFSHLGRLKNDKISTNAKEQTLRFICSHSMSNNVFSSDKEKDEILKNFENSFNNFHKHKKQHYDKKNVFVKGYDILLANSKRSAIAIAKEDNLKSYATKEFKKILNTCQDSVAMKTKLEKEIFKLKLWKSFGAFTALALTVRPIDKFVEHTIIKNFVDPQMDKIDFNRVKKFSEFQLK